MLGKTLRLYVCLGYDAMYAGLIALNATLADIKTINAEVSDYFTLPSCWANDHACLAYVAWTYCTAHGTS